MAGEDRLQLVRRHLLDLVSCRCGGGLKVDGGEIGHVGIIVKYLLPEGTLNIKLGL